MGYILYIYIDRALLFVFQSVMVVSSVCQVVGSFSCVLHGLVRFLEGLKTRFMRALKVLRVYRLSRGFGLGSFLGASQVWGV